ncbi:hypothetical protein V8G54_006151 [Vigna mungo]|uniref:Uncharacterized protein n=1 Tax=Vigna mungo TaxID=3915 RepID=A0AAQ3S7S5_VIGMU
MGLRLSDYRPSYCGGVLQRFLLIGIRVFHHASQVQRNRAGREVDTHNLVFMLTTKDLSFVGYTYKNFDAVKEGLRQSFGDSMQEYASKRAAEETSLQMLASSGDPMLP